MNLISGQKIAIHSYKHDHSLHRIWETSTVIEDHDDFVIVANRRTRVIEANGRVWYAKEPSVSFFYKERWFNVIGIIHPAGIYFYCNLASPILVDDEAMKYIDYDLDIKVLHDFSYTVLDQNEYFRHMQEMQYPPAICHILETELALLIRMIEKREKPFDIELMNRLYLQYERMLMNHA